MARALRCLALLVVLVAGCGVRWESEAEELSYLQSLSNPTPEQWKRRRVLLQKDAKEAAERDAVAAQERANEDARNARIQSENDRQARLRDNDPAVIAQRKKAAADAERPWAKSLLKVAMDHQDAGDLDAAAKAYQRLIDLYPNLPEGEEGRIRLDRLRAAK
jgi:TolA-binding protein